MYLIDGIHIFDWLDSFVWLLKDPLNDLVALKRAVLGRRPLCVTFDYIAALWLVTALWKARLAASAQAASVPRHASGRGTLARPAAASCAPL